jgi:REP element-mobilizing transposase RayT
VARKKREWYPGAMYHVMSRGNRRAEIFKDHMDHLYFLELIGTVKERYPFKIHSVCLMTNHFHIAIETGWSPPADGRQKGDDIQGERD